MKKRLKTLAKELGFNSENEYLEYIVQSFVNGQKSQCLDLFNAMSHNNKNHFIVSFLYISDRNHLAVRNYLITKY